LSSRSIVRPGGGRCKHYAHQPAGQPDAHQPAGQPDARQPAGPDKQKATRAGNGGRAAFASA
jgi:hypothetical protein